MSERVAFNVGGQAVVVPGTMRTEAGHPRDDNPGAGVDVQARSPSVRKDESPTANHQQPPRERRDWGYLGLLAFTAVVFLRPQDVFPPLEALHLAEVFALVGLVAMISGRLARQEPVLPLTPEVVGVMLFAGLMIALVPFSIWPGGSMTLLTGLYLKVVLIFVLMAGTLTTPARIERFVWLIVLASGYLAFRAVFDYARGINLIENGRVAGAVGGVFNNPNDLAMNMVAFLPPALFVAARRRPAAGRAVAAGASLLMLATIVFTKSRGGFLGLGAMLIVLLFSANKVRRGFGGAVLVAIVLALPLLPGSFWQRMASITDPSLDETGSREARRIDMREAWRMFLERPLTGVGPGQMTAYNPTWRRERWREAHNVFLQVAADDGVLGVLIFAYLVVRAFQLAWRASRALPRGRPAGRSSVAGFYGTAMVASFVGWFVCAMFASVAYTWTFYYVFGIAMAAELISRQERRHEQGAARPSPAAA